MEIEVRKKERERREKWFARTKAKPLHRHVSHMEVDCDKMIWMTSRLGRIGCSKTMLVPAKYEGLSHMLALDTHALSTFLIFSFPFKPVPRLTSFNFIPEALIILNQ
jgi:hypothetical protein